MTTSPIVVDTTLPPSPPRSRAVLPPQPGVPLLLLLTACFAVFFGFARALAQGEPTPLGFVNLCAYALCAAPAWSLLLVLGARWVRGGPWPIEPGLWLAAALGVRLLMDVLLSLPTRPVFQSTEAVLDAVTSLCLLGPLFSRHVSAHWKGVFTVWIALFALPLLAIFSSTLLQWLTSTTAGAEFATYGRSVFIVASLCAGAWWDRRQPIARSCYHRTGLILWAYYALLSLCR